MTDTQDAVIARIQKLLNLSAKNSSPAEAAAALNKARELMTQHNLDAATVENARTEDGKREQANVAGGFYAFERELWEEIAKLNFCVHWVQQYQAEGSANAYTPGGAYIGRRIRMITKRRHAVVGRVLNVRATVHMAQYLRQAIDRALDDALSASTREENKKSLWAWSFRKGCAEQIIHRLKIRYHEQLDKMERERLKKEREAARANAQVSDSRALVLANYVKSEEAANQDFIHGDGYSAKLAAAEAEAARLRREREDHYTRWCLEHPDEARSNWVFTDSSGTTWVKGRHRRGSSGGRRSSNTDLGGYYAGQDAGEKVSIDPQVDTGGNRRIAGRKK